MSGERGGVRFILDGNTIDTGPVVPTTTLLQYLRERLGRTGTKEGCAEGDCGACTVVLGELEGDAIRYRAVNSCIRFLPTVDGCEVVTSESLRADGDPLHPVQQAMVDCHASQCGFCTPGFVMSLFALYQSTAEVTREAVVDALSGNLCRCTGYRPIVEAGCRMHAYAAPQRWSRADAQSPERRAKLRGVGRDVALDMGAPPGFTAPRSLPELAAARLERPDALMLAGGTDVGLWVTKLLRELPPLLYLGAVPELGRVEECDGVLSIGAAVPLGDAFAAIVDRYPMLAELASRFASVPIRNSGTLGGNVANGSPIGDSMPVLIALGSSVALRCGDRTREVALEDFYLDYRKTDLAKGEFLEAVRVPLPRPGQLVASYKVSKRFDQDISAVCAGFAVTLGATRVDSARIAFGGMAAIPKRARAMEAALIGQSWDAALVAAAGRAAGSDFTPLSDMRASAEYRLSVAGNLLMRFFLESVGSPYALRVEQLDAGAAA